MKGVVCPAVELELHSEAMRKGQKNNTLRDYQGPSSVCCAY